VFLLFLSSKLKKEKKLKGNADDNADGLLITMIILLPFIILMLTQTRIYAALDHATAAAVEIIYQHPIIFVGLIMFTLISFSICLDAKTRPFMFSNSLTLSQYSKRPTECNSHSLSRLLFLSTLGVTVFATSSLATPMTFTPSSIIAKEQTPTISPLLLSSATNILSSYIVSSNHLVGNPSVCGKETTPAEAFTCLFQNITFSIPNIHVPNIKGKISLDLDNLKCSNFGISVLNIDTAAPKKSEHDITATLEGGTLSCSAHIKVSHIPLIGSIEADVTFSVSKLQFSGKVVTLNKNNQHLELPTDASLVMPQSNPTPDMTIDLHLKGNFIITIINALGKGTLESVIKKEILNALSTTVPTMVTPLLNGLIHNVSMLLSPFLNPPSTIPLPSNPLPKNVDPIYFNSGLTGSILSPLTKILRDTSEDDVPLIIHLIDFIGAFLGWDSGSITLNVDETIHIGDDGLSSSTNVTISSLKISGLDTMVPGKDNLYILDPFYALKENKDGNGLQLSTVLTFPKLSFDLVGQVDVAPGSIIGKGEGKLSAPATIHVDLSDIKMNLDVLLALDYHVFKNIELGQLYNINCILPSIVALNVTKFDLQSKLTPSSPPTVTFMSPGIDKLFDEIITVINGLYSQVLSEFVRGIVAIPIRNAINNMTTNALLHQNKTSMKCTKMPKPSNILSNVTKLTSFSSLVNKVPLLLNKVNDNKNICNSIQNNKIKCQNTNGCTFCQSSTGAGECYTNAATPQLPLGEFQCDRIAVHAYDAMTTLFDGSSSSSSSEIKSMVQMDKPLDFVNNPLMLIAFGFIDVVLNIENKPLLYTMNDAISTLTNHTGQLNFSELFNYDINFGNVHANVTIPYLNINGLNSFTDINFEATDTDTLSMNVQTNHNVKYTKIGTKKSRANTLSLDVGLDLFLNVTDPDNSSLVVTDLHEVLELSLLLPSTHLGSTSLDVLIDATALAAMTINNIVESPTTLAHAVHNVSLGHLLLNLPNITIELKCPDYKKTFNSTTNSSLTCTKEFIELSTLLNVNNIQPELQLTGLLETLLHDAVNLTLGQPLVHLLNDLIHDFLSSHVPPSQQQFTIQNMLLQMTTTSSNSSSNNSTPSVEPYTGIYPVLSYWLAIFSILSFILGIFLGTLMHCQDHCCYTPKKTESNNSMTMPLLNPNGNDRETNSNTCSNSSNAPEEIDLSHYSLMFHPHVPSFARLSIPLFLLSGALMYLSGNLNVGASVLVQLRAGGMYVPLPSLFDFSLGNSIRDMWNAQVYPLALLILLFSGVWPYVKLMMMFLCWVIPPNARCCSCGKGRGYRILKEERRGMWLQALDALGKWSLIDTFVLVMMMVAFRFHIQNQLTWNWITFLPNDFLVVDVIVKPNWGIFAFIVATVISLISTHVVIAFHRSAATSALDAEDSSSTAVRRFR
jgi:hypothetical protein